MIRLDLICLLFVVFATTAGCCSAVAADFRSVAIPHNAGCVNLQTQVITTNEDFDRFVTMVESQLDCYNKKSFLEGIRKANIDFSHESLVLIQDAEGSGSNRVDLMPPRVENNQLICTVQRIVPEYGTADMVYYCFGLVVNKDKIRQVRVHAEGRTDITLALR